MKSKMKKSTMLSILFLIIVLGMTIVILKQHKTVNEYAKGFPLEGTYIQTEGLSHARFIFSDQNKVYAYRPFGKLLEGTYAKTGDPNVYILKMNNHTTKYITLGKDTLTCIENDKTVPYRKESRGEIYVSVEHPQ